MSEVNHFLQFDSYLQFLKIMYHSFYISSFRMSAFKLFSIEKDFRREARRRACDNTLQDMCCVPTACHIQLTSVSHSNVGVARLKKELPLQPDPCISLLPSCRGKP